MWLPTFGTRCSRTRLGAPRPLSRASALCFPHVRCEEGNHAETSGCAGTACPGWRASSCRGKGSKSLGMGWGPRTVPRAVPGGLLPPNCPMGLDGPPVSAGVSAQPWEAARAGHQPSPLPVTPGRNPELPAPRGGVLLQELPPSPWTLVGLTPCSSMLSP